MATQIKQWFRSQPEIQDPIGAIKTSHSNLQKILFHEHFTWMARQEWMEAGAGAIAWPASSLSTWTFMIFGWRVDCQLFGYFMFKMQNSFFFFWLNVLNNLKQNTFNKYLFFFLFFFFFCSFTDSLARATYSWTMLSGCLISDTAIGWVFQKSLGPALCPWADMRHYHLILQGSNWRPEKLNDHLKSFII